MDQEITLTEFEMEVLYELLGCRDQIFDIGFNNEELETLGDISEKLKAKGGY